MAPQLEETTAAPASPQSDGPAKTVDHTVVRSEFIKLIPRDFARQHLILSQGRLNADADKNHVPPKERFAIDESIDPAVVHNVSVRLGVRPETLYADGEAVARAIDEAYGTARASGTVSSSEQEDSCVEVASDIDRLLAEADRDLLSTQGKGPIVKLVDALLFEALGWGASDIHVQPLSDCTHIRYRVDGVLHTSREVSRQITPSLTSRIKVMGRMDIAERRIPQDGRAGVTIGGRAAGGGGSGGGGGGARCIDLRISTLPTSYGERVVIRLLDNTQQLAEFAQLGMPPHVAEPFLECANAASGMILLTGPTGSGKTTTLYATLRTIGSSEVNIMTIEDPIEYELTQASSVRGAAISQSQVNTKKGVTFVTGLRHILRQDPDIVMVGEIRDGETARIAIQSSLTGHLVFSTLHTNDAASAITRLVDLGVESYLVGASLSCVLAQRLVRLLHADCGGTGATEAGGCEGCFGSGFTGRTGLFELLVVDSHLRDLISSNAALAAIRGAARTGERPMRTLAEDGARLIEAGRTTWVEVQRVVQGAS